MTRTIGSLVMGAALLLFPAQGHALSTTLDPATVNVGNIFTINLNVTGATNLTSFQFDLSFNPSLLRAESVTESSFFTQGDITSFTPGVIDNGAGSILGISDTLLFQSPVNGSGVLASIEFTALASGLSPLTLSSVFVDGLDSGFTVGNSFGCVLGSPACSGGSPVPEPSSVALLLLGGVTLWGMRRWQVRGATSR